MQVSKETLILSSVVAVIATIVAVTLGGSTMNQLDSESLEIKLVELKKGTAGDALLLVEIKNVGNITVEKISGELNFDTNTTKNGMQPLEIDFPDNAKYNSDVLELNPDSDADSTALRPGDTTVHVKSIPSSSLMVVGTSYTLSVTGENSSGNKLSDTAIVHVTRF